MASLYHASLANSGELFIEDAFVGNTEASVKDAITEVASHTADITTLQSALAEEVEALDVHQASADHDGRYYTEIEVDDALALKSAITHTHDDRYYTEPELDDALALKSAITHNHDGVYSLVSHTHAGSWAPLVHYHDDLYYDRGELDIMMSGKSAYDHDHDSDYSDIDHDHDDRYYTETQSDAKYAVLSHSHDHLPTGASAGVTINAVFGGYQPTLHFEPYSGNTWSIGIDSSGTELLIGRGSATVLRLTLEEMEVFTNRMYLQPESGSYVSENEAQLTLYNVADESDACAQHDGGSGEYVNLQLVLAARQHSTAYLTQWCLGIDASNTSSDGDLHFLYKKHTGAWVKRAYLSDSTYVSSIDFTGQHRASTEDVRLLEDAPSYIGRVVVSTGKVRNLDGSTYPTINESLPEIALASSYKQNAVYGVVSDKEEMGDRTYSVGALVSVFEKGDAIDRIIVNAVGEGAVLVDDSHGQIENGDLLTTSEDGYATKQDDDLYHAYTLGKATMSCTFEGADMLPDGRKVALLACTYHSG